MITILTTQMVEDFASALVGLFLLPTAFLMAFHLIRKWLT